MLEALKEIYPARHGGLEGFEGHLKTESAVSGGPTGKKVVQHTGAGRGFKNWNPA
jgi:hypothetical protein